MRSYFFLLPAILILSGVKIVLADTINVPADFSTIQQSIEEASPGDTILVTPGRYLENVYFSGKSVVVGSMYLTTRDTSYISKTILDGFAAGTTVTIRDIADTAAVLSGFTITNGSEGGIHCEESIARLDNLIIRKNKQALRLRAAGLQVISSNIILTNTTVCQNVAQGGPGGIGVSNSTVTLENVGICENIALRANIGAPSSGGGLFAAGSLVNIDGLRVEKNMAGDGGGVTFESCSFESVENLTVCRNAASFTGGGMRYATSDTSSFGSKSCNIYMNHAANGADIYLAAPEAFQVVMDTFTVKIPSAYHAFTSNMTNFDISTGLVSPVSSDLYVATNGDDRNDGLSSATPMRTLATANARIEADSLNPRTIFLAAGKYGPSTTGERPPFAHRDYVTIMGDSKESTILDAENWSRVMVLAGAKGNVFSNISLVNGNNALSGGGMYVSDSELIIKHSAISNGYAISMGGGLYCDNSQMSIENSLITKNKNAEGAGIYAVSSELNLENVQIIDNASSGKGGGIWSRHSQITAKNTSLQHNSATAGGGIFADNESRIKCSNVDFLNNSAGFGGGILSNLSTAVILSRTRFIANRAERNGGGILFNGPGISFNDVVIRDNRAGEDGGGLYLESAIDADSMVATSILLNSAGQGADIYSNEFTNVRVDTFTVKEPTSHHAYPFGNVQFEIAHAWRENTSTDIYVSPMGNDANSGFSSSQPLKRLSTALAMVADDSLTISVIHLAEGRYSPSTSGEIFPLELRSFTSLNGASRDGVIVDAESSAGVFTITGDTAVSVANMTVTGGYARQGGAFQILDSQVNLDNLTITANRVRDWFGGGINARGVSLTLSNSIISGNQTYSEDSLIDPAGSGGGLFITDARNTKLLNLLVQKNAAGTGGGLGVNGDVVIENSIIRDNMALSVGGGIVAGQSTLLRNTTIKKNASNVFGGGISGTPQFDSENRCSVYGNSAAVGNDFYAWSSESSISVALDTVTVAIPSDYHAYPHESFSFDANVALYDRYATDLYVDPVTGDDSNSGLTPSEAVRTITKALASIILDSSETRTIHLSDGVYSTETNGESFPLGASSNLRVVGTSKKGTIIRGRELNDIINANETWNFELRNVTLAGGNTGFRSSNSSDLRLSNLKVTECGIGISIFAGRTTINPALLDSLEVSGNRRIGLESWADLHTRNSLFADNDSIAISNIESLHTLASVTIVNNGAEGIKGTSHSLLTLINSILWGNQGKQVNQEGPLQRVSISYSNIQGWQNGIRATQVGASDPIAYLDWLEGNISTDPDFWAPDMQDYTLGPDSHCIDAGTNTYTYFDPGTRDSVIVTVDYLGDAPDMGAFEFGGDPNSVADEKMPEKFVLYQNYPNPFNPATTIAFELPRAASITLDIFNVLGQRVDRLLIRENRTAGRHSVNWDASRLASGIYFYRLEAKELQDPSRIRVGKSILIK